MVPKEEQGFRTWRRQAILRCTGLTAAGAGMLLLATRTLFPEAVHEYLQDNPLPKLLALLLAVALQAGFLSFTTSRCRPSAAPLSQLFLRIQRNDYLASAAQLVTWLLLGLLLPALQRHDPTQFQVYMGALLAGMAGVGLALFQLGLLRPATLSYWRTLTSGGADVEFRTRPFFSLQNRLVLVFGGLVFFSSGLSLAMSFAQQKGMVRYFVQRETQAVMEQLGDPRAASTETCRRLGPLASENFVLTWCSDSNACCAFGNEPGIRETGRLLLSRAGQGDVLRIPGHELEAVATRYDGGMLGVFMPTPQWAENGLVVTMVVYTLLFLFSAAVATQASREFSLPLRSLADQVRDLGRGTLDTAIVPLSADELGGLARDMEATRKRLRDRIAEINQLNASLEQRVEARTAELSAANEALRDAMVKLKEAQAGLVQSEKMAALGTLVAGMAHEMNNPLNAVLNNLAPLAERVEELAAAAPDKAALDEALDILKVMEEAAGRALQTVSDLRTYARKDESGRKRVVVDEGIVSTLRLLEHRIKKQGIQVVTDLKAGSPVDCFPGQMNQLVMNVLGNAIEALPGGGTIWISTELKERELVLTIRDSGPGVPPEHRNRIFDVFFTTRPTGTGLGLPLAASAAALHGGTLELVDSPQPGAEFRARIPIQG